MITVNETNTIEILINSKEIDMYNSSELFKRLTEAVEHNNKNIIINFKNIVLIDSAAIAILIKFEKFCKEAQRTLQLTKVSPGIIEILQILKVFNLFEII